MPKTKLKGKQFGARVNGVLVRKTFYSAAEARRWQRAQKELQDQIRSGVKRHLNPTLIEVAVADFLRARQSMSSFGHQETWLGKYVLANPAFQGKLLHEISRTDWKKLFGLGGELVTLHDLAPATHNRVRSTIHKLYEFARREYEPPRAIENPIHDIDPLKETRKTPTILETKEDIQAYLEAAYQDPQKCYGIYTLTKLNTGLRQQNLIPLRWKDDLGDSLRIREKYVRTKTFTGFRPGSKSGEEERTVGVNELLRKALNEWRAVTPFADDEDFIFATNEVDPKRFGRKQRMAGGHLSDKQVWEANDRTIARAGLKYMSEHKLRHSYATHYLESGGDLRELQRQLFHASSTTTEIYTHDLKSNLAKRAKVFQVGAPSTLRKDDDET